MQIVILYFSGTGNTYWAASEIAGQLAGHGWDASAVSIETVDNARIQSLIESADAVGLGYPVYGSDTPQPVKDLLAKLPEGHGKPALVFCTQWMFSGDGAMVAGRELRKRGYDIRWTLHLDMPNNICVTALPLPFTAEFARHIPRLARAHRRIARVIGHMVKGESHRWISCRLMGALQRVPCRLFFEKWRNVASVDPQRCNGCSRCASNCPVGNITMEDGIPRFHGNCAACLRCYDFCPALAIKVYGKLHREKRGIPYQGPVEGFRPEKLHHQ